MREVAEEFDAVVEYGGLNLLGCWGGEYYNPSGRFYNLDNLSQHALR